jgi:hypothetical protein
LDDLLLAIAQGNQVLEDVTREALQGSRELNRGNANPGAIGRDSARLGFDLWPTLIARDPRAHQLNRSLERLNAARNALAHADDAKLAVLRNSGCRVVLGTFRNWRRDVDALARKLDEEIGAWLGQAFGRKRPW